MNSPWDPRYEKAFYLAVNADKNYNIFKEVDDAQQFVEHTKSVGKGVVFHLLPIQTLYTAGDLSIQPTEVAEAAVDPVAEAQTNETEPEVIPPEVVAETPTE